LLKRWFRAIGPNRSEGVAEKRRMRAIPKAPGLNWTHLEQTAPGCEFASVLRVARH
jgi:hypothetical protein